MKLENQTFHLSLRSSNQKTGPIPVSTQSANTCPDACPLKKRGCYAGQGHLSMWWRKVSSGQYGGEFDAFLDAVRSLPSGQLWRYAQAGDLPGVGDRIHKRALKALAEANKGKRGFTYTHKPLAKHGNKWAILEANNRGLTVNVSCEAFTQVDEVMSQGLPAVVVLPSEDAHKRRQTTPEGRTVVTCPATRPGSSMTCDKCRLCSLANRPFAIGFPAHGTAKAKVESVIKERL